jgi:hypothetical protein
MKAPKRAPIKRFPGWSRESLIAHIERLERDNAKMAPLFEAVVEIASAVVLADQEGREGGE